MYDTMKEKINAKNNSIFYIFISLAMPTIVEQLLGTILQYVDTAMVGHLGPDATATVSLSSTYTWLLGSIIYACGVGFLSFIARSIGEGNRDNVKHAAGQAVSIALIVGASLTIITQIIAPYMPIWMGVKQSIRADASLYFRLINSVLIFRGLLSILGSTLRATGDSKTPMRINLMVNFTNIALNYIFIYVLNMGAVGAGWGTAISYTLGGIIMFIAFTRNKTLGFQLIYMKLHIKTLKPIMNITLPLIGTQIISCGGYIVANRFISDMATYIYAAHSIAITAEQLFYIPGYGMQAATSTLVGNSLGAGDYEKEHRYIRCSIITVFLLMLVSGGLLFALAPQLMSVFTQDESVIKTGAMLLRIVAFTEPVFGTTAVMEGVYSGLGRTKYPFLVELIGRWGVRILGSFIFVTLLGGGIRVVWYCMIADNITRAILLAIGLIIIIQGENK